MSPRFEFTEENKVASTNYDFPKLKLKMGERARILTGLEAPVGEYVHTLRAPLIVNGQAQTEPVKRKDGSTYEDFVMKFVSRPICLGDLGILADKGVDPKNCPMCKLAQDHPDYTTAPQLRYAMHVIRYRTKTGGHDLVTPYSVEALVWGFTGKTFNKIADFRKEWDDLRQHDLLLGPCTNEGFQQFDITVAAKAEWLVDAERKTLTARTFKENLIPDLSIACGSRKEKKWIDEDISEILSAWAVASNTVIGANTDSTTLDADLSGLMDDVVADAPAVTSPEGFDDLVGGTDETGWAKEAPADSEVPEADDVDAILGIDEPEAAEEPIKKPAAKKAPAPKAEEPAAEPSTDNFDDLLAGIE